MLEELEKGIPLLLLRQGAFKNWKNKQTWPKMALSATLKLASGSFIPKRSLKNQSDILNLQLTWSEKYVTRFLQSSHLQSANLHWKLRFYQKKKKKKKKKNPEKIQILRPSHSTKLDDKVLILTYHMYLTEFWWFTKFNSHLSICDQSRRGG